MLEIWQESASFHTKSQRLVYQVWTIIKKGWFSDLEILEIHKKTQKQENTIPVTSSDQKQHTRNEQPTLENKNATLARNPEETLSQEQKTNEDNFKRIMNSEKTKLPSLRNIEWRILETETNKIN